MSEAETKASIEALAEMYELYELQYGITVPHEAAVYFIERHLKEEAERKSYKNRWQLRIKDLIVNH